MALLALHKRSSMCKICTVFDENTLNEITLDILLERKTYQEIRNYYSRLLPQGIPNINDVNIRNHKRHCDPKLLAQDYLKEHSNGTTPGDILSKLYAEIYKEEIDKNDMLNELYRQRIHNMHSLQNMLDIKRATLVDISSQIEKATENKQDTETIENLRKKHTDTQITIRSLIKQIEEMQKAVQDIILKEKSTDKAPEGAVIITQNYINVLQIHMQGFLEELVPVLLGEFKEDPTRAKRILGMISTTMDKHLSPALDETKLLGYAKSNKVKNMEVKKSE